MTVQTTQKVLLVASYADSILNFRGPLIRDLITAGHEVIVAAPDISTDLRQNLQQLGALVEATPMTRRGINPLHDISYFRKLLSVIRKHHPDLVLTYTIKPNIWGAFAARSAGIASAAMVTGLGYAFTGVGNWKQRLIRKLAILLYRQATNRNRIVVFQNPDDRDDFINAGCLSDPSKVRMVNGSGVDVSYFAQAPLPSKPVFLMISRLLGNKGVREYGMASVKVLKSRNDARFLLVGYMDEGLDGISQTELDSWIAGGLEYLGSKKDVRPDIASASVYVLPSYREGTPRSVLEALSMGRSVITTDAPGCRETVKDNDNGFLVPVGDVQLLAKRMHELADTSELRQKMGERGREIAIEKYDVNVVNKVLMQHLGLVK